MKKSLFSNKLPFVFFLLFWLIFITTGCKNFFTGNSFLENLEDQVDYANAPEYSISVASTNADWGTITSGAGDHKKKVTDSIALNFNLNDGYKFINWKAVSKTNNSVSMADYVDFNGSKETSATAKLVQGSNDILITPVCAQLFAVTGDFTDDGAATYNRDSTITITFNQNLAESTEEINNVANIKLAVSGLTEVEDYFNSPVISGNKIVISCKADVLIPVAENTTRTVTVTIPADFCYYAEDVKMELGQKYTLSYTIDSSTTEKTSIKFIKDNSDSNAIFTVDGVTATGASAKYSIGQVVNLSYKNSEDFIFGGFSVSAENVVLIGDLDYDESKKIYSTIITVLAGEKEITITPLITKKGTLKISFVGINGSIIPTDPKTLYANDTFDLKFEEKTGYCFTEWQVLDVTDTQNQQVLSNVSEYLNFSPNASEQTVKVLKTDKILIIKTVADERPAIELVYPGNGKENLSRGVAIKIKFTQIMDKSKLTSEYITVKQGFMRQSSEEFLKESELATSILEYKTNTKGDMLTIQLKEDKYFTSNAVIDVHVSKDVCNKEKGITLQDDYSFEFQVGTETDAAAPIIDHVYVKTDKSKVFKVINFGTEDGVNRENLKSVEEINAAYALNNVAGNVLTNIVSNDKLTFYVKAADIAGQNQVGNEAKVSQIGYSISSVIEMNDGVYTYENTSAYNNAEVKDYTSTYGETKTTLDGTEYSTNNSFTINFSDTNIPDGILRVDVYAIDKKGNSSYTEPLWYVNGNGYRSFFVIKDSKKPAISDACWVKTFYTDPTEDSDGKLTPGHIAQNSYLKFKVNETGTGISDITVELKKGDTQQNPFDKGLQLKYSTVDTYASADNLQGSKKTSNDFTCNVSKENLMPTYTSGWYYLPNIITEDASDYTLTVTVTDAAGNKNVKDLSTSFKTDYTAPEWVNTDGPIVQSYGDTTKDEKVYPRKNNAGITSERFKDSPQIKTAEGKYVRWFYENVNGNNIKLEQTLKDSKDISNITYKCWSVNRTLSDGELSAITPQDVFDKGTVLNAAANDDTNKIKKYNNYFNDGTHSIAGFDDAGNTTGVETFVIVKDNIRPLRSTSVKYSAQDLKAEETVYGAEYRDIKYLVSMDIPSGATVTYSDNYKEWWNRRFTDQYLFYDWWEANTHGTEYHLSRKIMIKGTRQQIKDSKLVVKLSGVDKQPTYIHTDSTPLYWVKDEYWPDAWPSRTNSGTAQYYICRVYNRWRSENADDVFQPAFPPGTDLSSLTYTEVNKQPFLAKLSGAFVHYDKSYVRKTTNDVTVNNGTTTRKLNSAVEATKYFSDWVDYVAGSDIEIPINQNPFGYDIADTSKVPNRWGAPICVCFKDNCGNINFFNCARPSWSEFAAFSYRFDYTDYTYPYSW